MTSSDNGSKSFTLEPQYLYKLVSMPRGFSTLRPVSNRCNLPWYTVSVDFLGNCLLCDCDGWLPIPVGKVLDFDTLQDVFNSPSAKILQQDIQEGRFSWCAVDHCGVRDHDRIRTRVELVINIDESCNLSCASCRRQPIMIHDGPEFDFKRRCMDRIQQWLDQCPDHVHITTSGNGDPLASNIIRPFLRNYQSRPNHDFTLFTNGLLLKKQLHSLPILDRIRKFRISIDAGSAGVYQDVRRPGIWSVLLENLDYLRDQDKADQTQLNFALQNKNFHDLGRFVELCQHYGFSGFVHDLTDWGTWSQMRPQQPDQWTISNGVFSDHDVLDSTHPNHALAKQTVRQYLGSSNIEFSPAFHDKIKDR